MKELSVLSEQKNISKDEAKELLKTICGCEAPIIPEDILAYLTGYKLNSRSKTSEEVEKEMTERDRKHKKAIKFAKKKKLPVPEIDSTPIESVIYELENHPYGRNHKENFTPDMSMYLTFSKMMEQLQKYHVFDVKLRGDKPAKQEADERRLMADLDPVYRHQGHVVRAWREIQVDYQLAGNNIIFNETLKDYASFFAYLTEYQKLSNRLLKKEPRLLEIYVDIFKPFNAKANLFGLAFEEALTLCAGGSSKHNGVPAHLFESKKLFWDTFKEATKDAKDFFK